MSMMKTRLFRQIRMIITNEQTNKHDVITIHPGGGNNGIPGF